MATKKSKDPPTSGKRNASGHFKAGVSGNPGGRPKGAVSFRSALMLEARNHPERVKEMARVALQKAAKGDLKFLMFVAEQLDGKLKEHIDNTLKVVHSSGPSGGEVAGVDDLAKEDAELAELVSRGAQPDGRGGTPDGEDSSG